MQFGLGPLEKIFGPGGVQLKTQGSVTLNMGVKSNKTDNPAMSVQSRRKTYFDFDQQIQATVQASVGDKMKFKSLNTTKARRLAISQKILGLPVMAIYENGAMIDSVVKEEATADSILEMIKRHI